MVWLANIVTVADSDKNLREASVGTEILMDKITTFLYGFQDIAIVSQVDTNKEMEQQKKLM